LCLIVAVHAPAYVVAEIVLSLAFLDRCPAAVGHTLVVPRTHATDIWEISEPDLTAVMVMAKQVAHLLDERLSPDGLNLTQANRAAGWQEVFQFHVHISARWSGDGLTGFWKPSRPSESQLAATLARLR
jgi:histidine triad (HIT) family protein